MRKNGFFTFCFACVPGCGQMYQGYMRRGASLALWFFGIIGVMMLTQLDFLGWLLPVVWAYAFFDALNIRALSPQQRAQFRDDYIPNSQWLENHNITRSRFQGKGGRVAGWALIALGALLILRRMPWYYIYDIPFIGDFIGDFLGSLPTLVIAVVVIVLGLRILRGNTKAGAQDDITPFGAPPVYTPEEPQNYTYSQGSFSQPQPPAGPVFPQGEGLFTTPAQNPFMPQPGQDYPTENPTPPAFQSYAPPAKGEIELTLGNEDRPAEEEVVVAKAANAEQDETGELATAKDDDKEPSFAKEAEKNG